MKIGKTEITSIFELDAGDIIYAALEDKAKPEDIKTIDWLVPNWADTDGSIKAANQSFLIRVNDKNIPIDTCVGNDRN